MKKLIVFGVLLAAIIAGGFFYQWYANSRVYDHKVYIAVEGEGKIVAFDPDTRRVVKSIDLSVLHEGGTLRYYPHNVQVAPDGKSVWVTANAGAHEGHSSAVMPEARAHGVEHAGIEPDEILVIDPFTDKIVKRIQTGVQVQLAHVVLSPDSAMAYVTAQKEGVIYKVDARTFEIKKKIPAKKDSEPHGIRMAPDGSEAYIAVLKGKALGILRTTRDSFGEISLNGQAVQAGITPNGQYAVASLYDTKQLAMYMPKLKQFIVSEYPARANVIYIDLPVDAKGPIQMYPTPDSKFMYLADQGYYFNQPENDKVYKIDLAERKVVKEIKAGRAPHGVVVSRDGKFVYVTNLLGSDVSIIDTAIDREIGRVAVGKEPNGISVWDRP